MKRKLPGPSQSLPAYRLRAAVACFVVASLAACANWPANDDTPAITGELLRHSLPVAAAALAAGQLNVARRLYLSLSERFDNAPEPYLGLGYIALQSGDSAAAENHFLQAAERAADKPSLRAEALLSAGRIALAQGRSGAAKRRFRNAQAPAQGTASAAWIANGLAVASALRADYVAAEAHYGEALRLSSDNPRIAANLIRMLVAAGRIDDAARTYAQHPPSYWPDDDALLRLIEEARHQRRIQALARPSAAVSEATRADESPTSGDVAPTLGPTGTQSSQGGRQGISDLSPPRTPDPDLAMRLYLSDALPAQANADARPDAGDTTPDRSVLLLDFDSWPDPSAPPSAVSDSALNFSGSAVSADSDPRPSSARSSQTPDSVAVESGNSSPEPVAASPLFPSAPSGDAEPHPLYEFESPAIASPDHSPPTTFTLTLGQSRRMHLDRDATTVLVASPEVADVRLLAPSVLYVIGKGIGRTSVAVLDDDERIEERVISVVLDLEPLRTILDAEPEFRSLRTRRLSRGIALTGEVASAAAVDRALRLAAGALPEGVTIENDLRIAAPQQVNLEVQIAEVHRSVTEDLGVNWESFGIEGSGQFGLRVGRPLSTLAGNAPLGLAGLPPVDIGGNPAASILLGSQGPRGRFQIMIDALATAGLANVLARPNVTAVSGESASFFSGGERPIPTGYDSQTRTILFEYRKVGVLLDFVPTVVDSGRIVLTVRPEVSEPDASQPLAIGPVLLPVINVRRAETTVEVGDGESIVIAGLFRNRSSTSESGLPGLKDVPLLGLLFGKTSIRSNELELIVVVTARLVRANAAADAAGTPPETLRVDGYHY